MANRAIGFRDRTQLSARLLRGGDAPGGKLRHGTSAEAAGSCCGRTTAALDL